MNRLLVTRNDIKAELFGAIQKQKLIQTIEG